MHNSQLVFTAVFVRHALFPCSYVAVVRSLTLKGTLLCRGTMFAMLAPPAVALTASFRSVDVRLVRSSILRVSPSTASQQRMQGCVQGTALNDSGQSSLHN